MSHVMSFIFDFVSRFIIFGHVLFIPISLIFWPQTCHLVHQFHHSLVSKKVYMIACWLAMLRYSLVLRLILVFLLYVLEIQPPYGRLLSSSSRGLHQKRPSGQRVILPDEQTNGQTDGWITSLRLPDFLEKV